MGHIRGTSRTARRGLDGLKARALAKFNFHAPLKTSVALVRGVGAASYTGATVKTVKDFEGGIRNTLSGEVRFEGQRRVRNLVPLSSEDLTLWSKHVGVTVTGGQSDLGGGATAYKVVTDAANKGIYTGSDGTVAGDILIESVWLRADDNVTQVGIERAAGGSPNVLVTLSTEWKRYCTSAVAVTTGGSGMYIRATSASTFYVWRPQVEKVTGQSNQNPSEYVSVGADKLNMLYYTEAWTSMGSITGGGGTLTVTTGKDGTTATGGRITIGAANTTCRIYGPASTTVATGAIASFSVWAKKVSGSGSSINSVDLNDSIAAAAAITSDWTEIKIEGKTVVSGGVQPFVDLTFTVGGGNWTAGDTVDLWHPQYNVGATALAYFPVGNVYPFHGACVDGVKYFDYENGNTVSSNVVTEAVGRSLDGYAVGFTTGATGTYFTNNIGAIGSPTRYLMAEWFGTLPDYTPSAWITLLGRFPGGPNASWVLLLTSSGTLAFYGTADGTNNLDNGVQTSIATTAVDGARVGFRVLKDFVTGDITFWQSFDGESWTQFGTTKSGAIYTLFNTTAPVAVHAYGASGASAPTLGHCRRARVWHSNDATSTPIADFNPREGWTENIVQSSNDLSTALWTANGLSSRTASLLIEDSSVGQHDVVSNFVLAKEPSARYRFTVEAKPAGRTRCQVYFNTAFCAGGANGIFGLTGAGAATPSGAAGTAASITQLADGWYRCEVDATADPNTTAFAVFLFLDNGASNTYAGDGVSGLEFRKPQVRRLTVAGQRTSSQYLPVTSSAPLRGWISSTGEQWTINGAATVLQRQAEGYLPEGATTNLVLQSSNFGTTWTASGSITRTAAAAFCGDIALDLLSDADAAATSAYSQTPTYTGDAVKSCSLLVKQGSSTSSVVRLRDNTAGADRLLVAITWSNGAPAATYTTGSQERASEALGNGVFRIFCLTSSVTAANTHTLSIYPATDAVLSVANTGTIYVGGVQAENATVASSLIPTTTATVARNADVLTWPGAGNIGSAEGTIYAEVKFDKSMGASQVLCEFGDGTANERFIVYRNSAGNMILDVADGGVAQASINLGAAANGSLHKVAVRYKANDFAGSLNGAAVVTDVAGTLPTVTTIYVGQVYNALLQGNSPFKNLRIAQVALSNGELVAISK